MMEGSINVTYTVLCAGDVDKAIKIEDILNNEKVLKAIKSEFAKGLRNIELAASGDCSINIRTQKEKFEFTARKNDFADLLELAEEDAKKNKRIKKGCDGIELVDIVTVD